MEKATGKSFVEMDFWRRSAKVSHLDRIRNEVIENKMKVNKDIVQHIEERQLCWYGHVQWMNQKKNT